MRTGLWPLPPPRTIGKGDASGSSGGSVPSLIPTNIVAYYKKDDLSGVDTDSAGANNLADNGTVTSVAGKVGTARQYTAASSEFHSIADNAALSMGDIEFTLAGWILLDSLGAQRWVFCKGDSGLVAATCEYALRVQAANTLRFHASNGIAIQTVTAAVHGALASATWYFVECWHDPVGDILGIRVNNGTANTLSYSAGVQDAGFDFKMGTATGAAEFWNGALDEWMVCKSVLTQAQRDYLWNAGAGRTLP